jgi:hypothetical protein
MADIRQIIEFLPIDMEWTDWNGNLLHYYGQEPIPYVSEENWDTVADYLSGLSTFANYAVPNSDGYTEWQDWAKAFVEAVNGATR